MKHTQSAGAILINKSGQIALVSNKGYSWGFPKGHVEIDEETIYAAVREVWEETGIADTQYIKELGTYERLSNWIDENGENKELKTITLFLLLAKDEKLVPQDPHNPVALWINSDEVISMLTHPVDKEFYLSIQKDIKEYIKPNMS